MAWQTPRTSWAGADGVAIADMDRIEGNLAVLRQASGINVVDSGNYYTGTDVETVLQELGADLVTAKAALVSALTTKNQVGTTADSLAYLANKVTLISTDASAAVGDVLSTKTFYSGGLKQTGTMPNNAGIQVVATGLTTDGAGNLYLNPTAGYFNTLSSIKRTDANFVAGNIKYGTSMLGLTGSYVQMIKGTITATGANQTVTGLIGVPKDIIVYQYLANASWQDFIMATGNMFSGYVSATQFRVNGSAGSGAINTGNNTRGGTTPTNWIRNITSSSFMVDADPVGGSLNWYALYY